MAPSNRVLSSHGTFYELPAENADGFAKIRPVASHNFRIHDYASYRGMLVMTGIDPDKGQENPHVILSDDGNAAVWVGVIDDLWKMGKPTGKGGPWKNVEVNAGDSSDPYLIGFYDKKMMTLSHTSKATVTFTVEVEPIGHGPWMITGTLLWLLVNHLLMNFQMIFRQDGFALKLIWIARQLLGWIIIRDFLKRHLQLKEFLLLAYDD